MFKKIALSFHKYQFFTARNYQFFKYLHHKTFCTKIANVEFNQNMDKELASNDTFQKSKKEVGELLKVANTKFDFLSVNETIKVLLICARFQNYPQELVPKIEKKFLKLIQNMDEEQITQVIYGFSLLKYKSSSLSFMIEKTLVKKINSFKKHNFVLIFNCFGKFPDFIVGTSLINTLKQYIETNVNKFSLKEACDIFINFPRILLDKVGILRIGDKDTLIITQLFNQLYPHLEKIDSHRFINIYFLLFSQRNYLTSLLFKDLYCEYNEGISNIIKSKESEIDNKLTYLIVSTHHYYNKEVIKNPEMLMNLSDLIYNRIVNNISIFTPEEINAIITVILNNKESFNFSKDKLKEICGKFIEIAEKDKELMSNDEILLYYQSLLFIKVRKMERSNLDGVAVIESEIVNKRINSFNLYQSANLLEIIHHFTNKNILFKKEILDKITENIINKISFLTNEDILNTFDDYYLITLSLFDIKYRKKSFWAEFFGFSKLYTEDKHLLNFTRSKEKVNKLLTMKEIIEKETENS